MTTQRTTTRTRKPSTGPVWLLALVIAVVMAVVLAAVQPSGDSGQLKHTGSVNATDGDPAFVVPSPTAVPRPLRLTPDFPPLSDQQQFWEHAAAAVWRLPIAFGIDQPPIALSDNEAAVFVAIIYGECSFNPYDPDGSFKVNSIGARGCGQLLGGLVTDANMTDPMRNLYDAAAYWRAVLDDAGGDIVQALRHYRGVADSDHDGAATSVFSSLRVAP